LLFFQAGPASLSYLTALLLAGTGVKKGKQKVGALPQTLMETGAGPWMLLALLVLPFALFGCLLRFF